MLWKRSKANLEIGKVPTTCIWRHISYVSLQIEIVTTAKNSKSFYGLSTFIFHGNQLGKQLHRITVPVNGCLAVFPFYRWVHYCIHVKISFLDLTSFALLSQTCYKYLHTVPTIRLHYFSVLLWAMKFFRNIIGRHAGFLDCPEISSPK